MSYPKQQYIPVNPQSIAAAKDADILSAIRMCNIERCDELITSDKEILHIKGWNEITPLHQACLSGQLSIVKLFLEKGANPDAPNSFRETPLHYACRRGIVSVVHMMIKNGADISALDKQGRNCMHFAALGGSVVMLHYLHTHTDLEYDTPDDKGKNVLHISCDLINFGAISYLLKHNRVDPSLKDFKGVTPAHITVEHGHGDLTWLILKAGGCELLQVENQKGETPFDIAKQGSTTGHKKIVRCLQYYSFRKFKKPPSGPRIAWFFMLMMPFLYLAAVFFLSVYMNSYSGHFSLLSCLILVFIIGRQRHRIAHISRWPNPVYLGAFVGGIAHCAFAQYGHLQRALWPCPLVVMTVTTLTAVIFYLFWYLLYMDPGIDKTPKLCPTTGRPMTVLDIAEGRASESEFCTFSEIIHDSQTKFCRLCEAPMLNLDHHCLFLNTCVAKNNHKHFIIMLLVVMSLQINFVICTGLYMNMMTRVPEGGLGDPISVYLFHLYRTEAWLFCLLVLCVVSCLWESCLVYAQLSVIARGSTTYLTMKNRGQCKGHKLSNKEKFRNVVNFFLKPNNQLQKTYASKENVPLMHV